MSPTPIEGFPPLPNASGPQAALLLTDLEPLAQAHLAQQALAAITEGVLITGPDRKVLLANQAFEKMSGYRQAELMGRSCALLQGPLTNRAVVEDMRGALTQQVPFHAELLNYRKDGSSFWNELSINPVLSPEGELTHFVGVQRDVSQRREQQTQLELAAQVIAQTREGIIVTDAQRTIVMVNPAFTKITGYTPDDVLGKNVQVLRSHRLSEEQYRDIRDTLEGLGRWQGELLQRRKDGSDYSEWAAVGVLRNAEGCITHRIMTISDISEQKQALAEIDRLTHFDALTDLPNRALLAERCSKDIDAARRDGGTFAMLILGIDHFKVANDTMGHWAGDQLLKQFAQRVKNTLREQDTMARVGGDEFVLILPGDTTEAATRLAERLLRLDARPYRVGSNELILTASIGVAMFPNNGEDFTRLYEAAEVAMHQAKELGRRKYQFFSAQMYASMKATAAMAAALRGAVAREELHLHYQPFADLQTGEIGGVEALLRWTHPDLGAVSPGTFIPIAERNGLITQIGAWVFDRVCRDIRDWIDLDLPVPPVSVNISPVQFRDPGLLQSMESTLTAYSIPSGMLCVEVTEGALIDDVRYSEALLREFKTLGMMLSVDDFGTGYSSLGYLKLFPFDKVKIDQSFVRDIVTCSQDAMIAKVVISMAHGLGLRVIAEGVETEVQCEFMRNNHCDEIQGYFFSRPVPKKELERLLRARHCLPSHLVRGEDRPRNLRLV